MAPERTAAAVVVAGALSLPHWWSADDTRMGLRKPRSRRWALVRVFHCVKC